MNHLNNFISILEKSLNDYDAEETILSSNISAYFIRMGVPDDLRHIDHVSKEVGRIIEVLKKVSDKNNDELFECWETINKHIKDNVEEIAKEGIELLSFVFHKGELEKVVGNSTNASIHGKIKKHPLYALLWCVEDSEIYSEQYLMLKSVMFRIWPRLTLQTSKDYIYIKHPRR